MSNERTAYQKQVEEKLNEYGAKLDEWKAKGQQVEARLKAGYYARIEESQNKHNELRTRVSELRRAGEETWDKTKAAVETALEEVRKSLSDS